MPGPFTHAARLAAARMSALAAGGGSALALYSPSSAEARCRGAPQTVTPATVEKHRVVVLGGGSAGLSVAAQLMRKLGKVNADVAIIEPGEYHYYRPGWTMAGAGIVPIERSRRPMEDVMPKGATWVKARASKLDPSRNRVVLDNGGVLEYEYLVLAPGMELDLSRIKGLQEALDAHDGVYTIWSYNQAAHVWDGIRNLTSGVALFTQPKQSRGCGGAPQKIMWLAEDFWRTKTLVRDAVHVEFVTGRDALFPIPKYAKSLADIGAERGVYVDYDTELVAVDGPRRLATFQQPSGMRVTRHFDLLVVTPHMGPPAIVRDSPLAAGNGFADVDIHTLQHAKYPRVFALGDCANLPTSKTAAAITAQAPVVVFNILASMGKKGFSETAGQERIADRGKPLSLARYDGYSSSPILTRRGGLILAEFKYGGEVKETFPFWFDQHKEVSFFYALTTGFFPWAYWNLMLTGRWYGPRGVFEPRLKFVDTWLTP